MSAYANPYVQIGTLILRTRAIECFDWSDLFQRSKRGDNRTLPGVAGRAVRPRVSDQVRAALPVRLNGAFVVNAAYAGDRHLKVYDHLADVAAVADVTTTQTLTFYYGVSSVAVDCQVEEMTAPNFLTPSLAVVTLSVTLPDGPISLTVGS